MNLPFPILYEDTSILVCIKPPKLPVQSRDVRTRDMESLLLAYLKDSGGSYLGVIHRLDTNVRGIMVFAKSKAAAAKLSEDMRNQQFKKTYHAWVIGHVKPAKGTLLHYLYKDPRSNTSTIVQKETKGSKKARLSYCLLSYNQDKDASLLEINLETGRHHQIRLQLSHIGHPIIGDTKYGAPKTPESNLCLEAFRLSFPHPVTGEVLTFCL